MNLRFKQLFISSVILMFISSVYAQDNQPSPEQRAYKFRTSLFQTFAWKLGQMAEAKAKDDEALFVQQAKDLAYLSTMIEEGFKIEGSLPEGTNAKPAIWEDFEEFQGKASNMTELTEGFTKAGAMADFDPRAFGSKACGACHRDFKVKD